LAYKKGILTESDIRVLEDHSKKRHSDLVGEKDKAGSAGYRKEAQEPRGKS